MTAHAMTGDEQKSIAAGMNDHVTKPIDPDQLFGALQKWIKPVAEQAAGPKGLPASGGPAGLDPPPDSDQAVPGEDELPESLPGFETDHSLFVRKTGKTIKILNFFLSQDVCSFIGGYRQCMSFSLTINICRGP